MITKILKLLNYSNIIKIYSLLDIISIIFNNLIFNKFVYKKINSLNIILKYLLFKIINKKFNNKKVFLMIKTDFLFKI